MSDGKKQAYTPKYKLKVDELTFADIRFFSMIGEGLILDYQVVEWMDKLVEGGVMHLPRSEFNTVYNDIARQYYNVGNPTDNEGKA